MALEGGGNALAHNLVNTIREICSRGMRDRAPFGMENRLTNKHLFIGTDMAGEESDTTVVFLRLDEGRFIMLDDPAKFRIELQHARVRLKAARRKIQLAELEAADELQIINKLRAAMRRFGISEDS